jgi:hypothetical protein
MVVTKDYFSSDLIVAKFMTYDALFTRKFLVEYKVVSRYPDFGSSVGEATYTRMHKNYTAYAR